MNLQRIYHSQEQHLFYSFLSFNAVRLLFLFVFTLSNNSCKSFTAVPTTMNGIRPFAVNVELEIKPERRDEFLNIISYDAKQTIETEPGAIQFTIGCDVNKENTYHLHEQYKSEEDFKYHCSTEHFAKWKEFCNSDPFLTPNVVQFYQCFNERQQLDHQVTTTGIYCLNVELCIKESVRDEFLAVIHNNQMGSRTKEPLCIQYDYGESTTTPNSFYFHEQYIGNDNGKEGFDAHAKSDHFLKWEQFAGTNPFTKDPVVSFFQNIPY